MSRKLLSLPPIQSIIARFSHIRKHRARNVKHFEGLSYFPRDTEADLVEEPITEPAKLFRVQRIKTLKGQPSYYRRTIAELGLAESLGAIAILKNIPENNMRLMRVKHLIRVDPITFPYGEPTEYDINHTYLTPTGECIVTKEIAIDPKRIEAADKFINDPNRLDKDTLHRDALRKWINPQQ